jgi:hypothetical protein
MTRKRRKSGSFATLCPRTDWPRVYGTERQMTDGQMRSMSGQPQHAVDRKSDVGKSTMSLTGCTAAETTACKLAR